MAAPIDDPATAIAAAISAVPPAPVDDEVAVTTVADAGAAGAADNAAMRSPTAATSTAQFSTVRMVSPLRRRRLSNAIAPALTRTNTGTQAIQTVIGSAFLSAGLPR